jgi:hypothetical protein
MIWFSGIIFVNCLQTASALLKILKQNAKLFASHSPKVAWFVGTAVGSGASLTLHRHSMDSHGGHEMVWQQHILSIAFIQHQLHQKLGGKVLNSLPAAQTKK